MSGSASRRSNESRPEEGAGRGAGRVPRAQPRLKRGVLLVLPPELMPEVLMLVAVGPAVSVVMPELVRREVEQMVALERLLIMLEEMRAQSPAEWMTIPLATRREGVGLVPGEAWLSEELLVALRAEPSPNEELSSGNSGVLRGAATWLVCSGAVPPLVTALVAPLVTRDEAPIVMPLEASPVLRPAASCLLYTEAGLRVSPTARSFSVFIMRTVSLPSELPSRLRGASSLSMRSTKSNFFSEGAGVGAAGPPEAPPRRAGSLLMMPNSPGGWGLVHG